MWTSLFVIVIWIDHWWKLGSENIVEQGWKGITALWAFSDQSKVFLRINQFDFIWAFSTDYFMRVNLIDFRTKFLSFALLILTNNFSKSLSRYILSILKFRTNITTIITIIFSFFHASNRKHLLIDLESLFLCQY